MIHVLQWGMRWIMRCAILVLVGCGIYLFLQSSRLWYYLQPNKEHALYIYSWADKIDEQIVIDFEEKTGIKVYINYYDSAEELLAKLELARDDGCDLILPSGYMIDTLKNQGFLKKIDKTKLRFWHRLAPELMHFYFDEDNAYSIPLYWDFMVLAYDTTFFPQGLPQNSWKIVYEKDKVPCSQIGMVDDAREALYIWMMYARNGQEYLSKQDQQDFVRDMIRQRDWVGAYTDFQHGYYLASQTYPLVVSLREYIARDREENEHISFVIPQEGTIFSIDNFAIFRSSVHEDEVYQFLNYFYDRDILLKNCRALSLLPAVKDVVYALSDEEIGAPFMRPGQKNFSLCKLFPNQLTQKELNDLWIQFKCA